MSTSIDQRVVEMRFDNKQFENNVSTTMSTLEKLKRCLNLSGASKGLENVSAAAKGVNLSPIGSAAETVGLKFNAMYTIADQALRNITNSAVNYGKRIVSALTIDPIKTGLSEYETQINAVQTILANTESKGTTLQDVNNALDTLNTYADKTIYNFTEMTRNIGTFTAAGVDLDTSVNAIQGIANLAAVSGSTSQQASTAMYQLSQALSSGTVKLMDWNSVVNAGMGGQVFQDALKETARVHGVNVDKMIEKHGSFRETLQEGWITSDILTETLSHFTMAAEEGSKQWETYKKSLMDDGYTEEQAKAILKLSNTATDAATKVKTASQLWDTLKETAQSGWTQTWEIILGDFGEAKKLFSGIYETLSPILENMSKSRNELLEAGLSSGWKQLLGQGIADEEGYKDSIKNVAKEHGVAIDDMIKAEKELDSSLDDNEAFQKVLQKGLKDGSITSDMLSESVTNLADKMRNMTAEERKAAGYTDEHVAKIEELEKGLKDGTISMDEFVKKMMRPSGRENVIEALYNAFKAVMSIISPIKEAFRDIFPGLTGEQLYSFTEALRDFTAKLTLSETASNNLKRTFRGLFAIVDIVKQAFVAVVKAIAPLFGGLDNLGGGILGVTASWGDWLASLNESIKASGFFTKVVEKVHGAIEKVKNFLVPAVEGIKDFGAAIGAVFTDAFNIAVERLSPLAVIGTVIKNVFVGIGNVLKKVAPWLFSAATGIGNVLSDLMGRITAAFQNANFDGLFDLANGGIITAIGVYIAKMFKSGSDIFDNAAGFVENINNILEGAGDALGAFQDSLKADTLKKIAIAIGILAASLLVLSLIPSDKLTVALVSITTLFGELMGAMAILGKLGDLKGVAKMAGAMISLSTALLVLSVAMRIMSAMSPEEMAIAIFSMVAALGSLITSVKLLSMIKPRKLAKTTEAIESLAKSLLVLSIALKVMSTMSPEEMGVAILSMVAGLGSLIAAVKLLPKGEEGKIAGLIGITTSLIILAAALKIMATMSWEEMGIALISLAGSLGILVGAMALMQKCLPGATAIKIIAPALIMLALSMKIMATMSWEEIGRGLAVLAGSLIVLSIAMAAMKKSIVGAAAIRVITPALLSLAIAMKIMGSMSWEDITRGLILLAGAFVVIGVAGAVLGPLAPMIIVLAKAIAILGAACLAIGIGAVALGIGLTAIAAAGGAAAVALTTIVASIIGLIPYLIEQIGVGIIRLCEVISGSAAAICEAVAVIIVALVDAIVASVPALVEGALVLIVSLLESLAEHAPAIVGALFDFIIGIIHALADKLPDLIQAGVDLLMSLFVGIIDALKSIDTGTLINGLLAVGLMTALVTALAAIALLTPAAMVGVLGLGAVIAELSLVLAAVGALAQIPGLDWLISEGGNFMQTIGNAIGKFIGGIAGGFAEGMSASLPQIGTDLSAFMDNASGFIEGAKNIDATALEGVKSLVGIIAALTAVDILEGLTSWITGGSSLTKFGEEIAAFAPNIRTYADTVAGIDAGAVTASATAAQALAEMTKHIPNEGGMVAWFTGENSISKFGTELVTLGMGLKMYSMAITGFNAEAVIASANAATALAEMTSHIPNEGGVAAWFAGENSIAKFGNDLVTLGMALSAYSFSIMGFNPEAVIASANAAKALADMTSTIPNEGGMVAWFAGENSIAKFGNEIVMLGSALSAYSWSIMGFNAEAVIASANAAKALADMTSHIPNEGGMTAWFTGENSISKFGSDLIMLGMGLRGFSMAVTGINIESMMAAANAAKTLAQMTSYIPNEGGMVAWFTGENSLAKFGTDIVTLGKGLKGFSDEVEGINAENVTAAANAAKSLAVMASYIPNEGGIAAWFTGENSVSKFADKLPALGKGLKGFSDEVDGISPENVTAAANAAKSLAQMAETTPKDTSKLKTFGENLVTFGEKLKTYFDKLADVSTETISASGNAIKAVKDATSGLNPGSFKTAAGAIDELVKSVQKLSKIKASDANGFASAIKKIADTNVESMITAFKNAGSDMKKAGTDLISKFIDGVKGKNADVKKTGQTAIDKFVDGIEARESSAKNACRKLAGNCSTALRDKYDSFKSAGKHLVDGFASGISAKTWYAEAKAKAMANAAEKAAKNALDINSPSKVFRAIGYSVPEGLALGIDKMGGLVTKSSVNMTTSAINSVKDSIARISDVINSDIDAQPTIRPVVDLTNVKAGASVISGLMNTTGSVGVMANVHAINASMNSRNQNGVNSDVVTAIDRLNKKMDNLGNTTYQINGVTYDDGSNVSNAVRTIVRAARIERRV